MCGRDWLTPRITGAGYELRGTWKSLDGELPASALQRLLTHKVGGSLQLAMSLDDRLPAPDGIRACELDTSGAEATCDNLGMSAADVLAANPPVYFRRNIGGIVSLAQSRGVEALLLTWAHSPYVYDAPNGDVMSQPFRQTAVAEHNALIRELADESGALFYDMAERLPDDRELWFNGVHQSAAGAAEMARLLADFLAKSGAID